MTKHTIRKHDSTSPVRPHPALRRPAAIPPDLTGNLWGLFGGALGIAAHLAPDGSVLASNLDSPAPLGVPFAAHFKLESPDEIGRALQRIAQMGQAAQIEVSSLSGEGVRRWYLLRINPMRHGDALAGFGVLGVEITERKREELRLRRSEAMMVDTQGVAHLGIWEWDITQPHAVWSPELYRIYGETPESYTPTYEGYLKKVHPDDRQRVMDATNEVFHNLKPYSHDERIFRADGSLCYLHTWAFPVLNDVGKLIRLTGVCQDITDRKLAELERDRANELALSSQRLALHRAQYDELTRLPNRAKFRDDLNELMVKLAVQGRRLGLVKIGLDHFSAINHALGHDVGDAILGEIADRLARHLPGDALLARLGPDVFGWVAEISDGAGGTASLVERCDGVQKVLSAPLETAEGITVAATLGCALYPEHAKSTEQLLQAADSALHWAKEHGHRGLLKMYEPDMRQIASSTLELNKALHHAIERGQIKLHYQPIMSLGSNTLSGVEALARWRREDGSYLPPDKFIPVIEGGNLLRPFTEWALHTACEQMADWRKRGIPVPYMSINLSAAQLRLDHIEGDLLELMREHQLPGSSMVVEVTEGALLENLEVTRDKLAHLRQYGLEVAVDDFGVGYASPNYLRVLPISILKIDGSFLKDVPENLEATALLNGIIEIGRSLNLKVVTECVETEAHAAYLAGRGVNCGQGYWFSRALPANELEPWIQKEMQTAVA